jgi:hypothetical protein
VAEKTNPLVQPQSNLASGADAAGRNLATTQSAGVARLPSPESAAMAVGQQSSPTRPSCTQCITMAFFFDGTGNNLDADVPSDEHSNVARLFRNHPRDDVPTQRYARYIPGIGTYFKDIGDPGGTTTGRGMGAYGQARLDWAFKELGTILRAAEARANNPSNPITAVRISVFGFSRGSASARAFCRDLQRSCTGTRGNFKLKGGALATSGISLKGGYPVEVYFLGIFDTVASVGLPLSTNNIHIKRQNGMGWRDFFGDGGWGRAETDLRLLAFGQRGADPSPGSADGHGAWANGLQIADIVGECLHMVAGHEMRNSFPLDSALQGTSYPTGTTEMIYPGVHSDVGGGYRQGEGGKSAVLSRVPLRVMLEKAVAAGVPLYSLSQLPTTNQKKDFAVDADGSKAYRDMMSLWSQYMQPVNRGAPLGAGVLAHMREYWRYRLTVAAERTNPANAAGPRRNRRYTTEQQRIRDNETEFAKAREPLVRDARIKQADYARIAAQRDAAEQSLLAAKRSAGYTSQAPYWEQVVRDLRAQEGLAADAARSAQALADTAANDSGLIESLDGYDGWLLQDAELLHRWRRESPAQRMRPHYAAIADAYQEVVAEGKRMAATSAAYQFFNTYVHDSLAGFAQDNTRPSDPRVIYIGGDVKKDYAAMPAVQQPAGVPA